MDHAVGGYLPRTKRTTHRARGCGGADAGRTWQGRGGLRVRRRMGRRHGRPRRWDAGRGTLGERGQQVPGWLRGTLHDLDTPRPAPRTDRTCCVRAQLPSILCVRAEHPLCARCGRAPRVPLPPPDLPAGLHGRRSCGRWRRSRARGTGSPSGTSRQGRACGCTRCRSRPRPCACGYRRALLWLLSVTVYHSSLSRSLNRTLCIPPGAARLHGGRLRVPR